MFARQFLIVRLRVSKFHRSDLSSFRRTIYVKQMEKSGRLDDWNNRWATGKTGWHHDDVNPMLEKYGYLLNLKDKDVSKRIFIPLCGKAFDIKWFYDSGHTVVGVEGNEEAVIDFFNIHNIPHEKSVTSYGSHFKSTDGRLSIHVGDLFALSEDVLGKFDVVWDRGSLVAIYIEDRERYIVLMKSVLSPKYNYLLSTVHYDGLETASGPPRCIPEKLVEKLYGDISDIKHLETFQITDERSREAWKLDEVYESCFHLTRKAT